MQQSALYTWYAALKGTGKEDRAAPEVGGSSCILPEDSTKSSPHEQVSLFYHPVFDTVSLFFFPLSLFEGGAEEDVPE